MPKIFAALALLSMLAACTAKDDVNPVEAGAAADTGADANQPTTFECQGSLSDMCCGRTGKCPGDWASAEACNTPWADSSAYYGDVCGGFRDMRLMGEQQTHYLYDAQGKLAAVLRVTASGVSCDAGPRTITIPAECQRTWIIGPASTTPCATVDAEAQVSLACDEADASSSD